MQDQLTGVWETVVGQPLAVQFLRDSASRPLHAYLFVGPRGVGKRAAARALAAAVLGADRSGEDAARTVKLALEERHPDLVVIEPDGNVFRGTADRQRGVSPGQRLLEEALASPREGPRKVVVAVDFHLANDVAVGRLLKVIEEPPATVVLVLLEEEVPPEQITVASRCSVVHFGPVPTEAVRSHLEEAGVESEMAALAAEAAGGDLRRAVLLGSDPALRARHECWSGIPATLDGSGHRSWRAARDAEVQLAAAQAHLDDRHRRELEELDEQAEQFGARGLGRAGTVERQKREVRQARTGELLFGLATLARRYRDELAVSRRPREVRRSLEAIQAACEALERNPVEALLLEQLFLSLEPLGPSPAG